MTSIDEKRVYSDQEGTTTVYVGTELGVARVEVSGDIIGEFSLAHRCVSRDTAATDGALAVATDEDVLDTEFSPLDFGPAVAVGFDGDDLLAAGDDGRLARYNGEWNDLATVDDVRAIDGNLVATADGVYRVSSDGVQHVGLTDVRDVSAAGGPLAATADGLYRLGNGWMDVLDGSFRVVSATAEDAYAATAENVVSRDGDDWQEVSLPVSEPVAAIGFDDGVYAATEAGTFLVRSGDGWRNRHLGLTGVTSLSVR
ncbi:HVO_0234 family beta-propeller protein [Haladaptatus sp.]|uniref:HVO_0234 family beta-propeller protein n=1 Tax=Haladaptatus sp. TaxID=1973141 RepID=UPI003C62D1A9